MRSSTCLALVAATCAVLSTTPVGARVAAIEIAFGASNLAAIEGNGRLTVGVSPDGDIAVLSWPSPSYFDHIHALQANGLGASELPRMGLHDGMGAFAALAVRRAGGALELTRLHDPAWTRVVRYVDDDASVIEAVFENDALGLAVTQRDSVQPDADLLLRRYVVERLPGSDVEEAWLVAYQNLSPGFSKIAKVPMADVLLDHKNDFLAAWDAERQALVQFHPGDTGVIDALLPALEPIPRDFGPLGELLEAETLDEGALDALLADLDASYAPGVYAMIGTRPAPDEIQVGTDATDTCAAIDTWIENIKRIPELIPDDPLPVDVTELDRARCGDLKPVDDVYEAEGWRWRPEDALADALDGSLSGSRLAGAQANAALKVPLAFDVEGDGAERARATLFLAFGATHAEASATLEAARELEPVALEARAVDDDHAFARELVLPEGASERLRRFSKRTLLNLRVGTDAETSAIVASVSRQPPYQLDWPRDGAFFNVALDLAGVSEVVTRRMDFYASVIRDEESPAVPLLEQPVPGWPDCEECTSYPPDSWEMNYYADGTVGGNIRLEIDNTALLVWSFVTHAGYLEEAERDAYLERVYPTVRRAADFLASWRDEHTGLVWYANEDDHASFTQGLQGAVTVFGALVSAARVAKALGDDEAVKRWTGRAGELREALLEHLYDEEKGFLVRPKTGLEPDPPASIGGAAAWLAWPAHVLPYDDERVQEQLRRALEVTMPKVRGEGPGGAYTTKVGVSAALALPPGELRDQTLEMAERLVGISGETLQLGESFVNVDDDGDGETDRQVNAVAPPHLWAAALVYLTAMAYYHPDRFDAELGVLPEVYVPGDPVEEPPPPEGCGCTGAPAKGAPALAVVVPLALLFALGARRRR